MADLTGSLYPTTTDNGISKYDFWRLQFASDAMRALIIKNPNDRFIPEDLGTIVDASFRIADKMIRKAEIS